MKLYFCILMSLSLFSAEPNHNKPSKPIPIPKPPKKIIRVNKKYMKSYWKLMKLRGRRKSEVQKVTK